MKIMKKAIKLMFAAVAVIAAASCQKEIADASVSVDGARTYSAIVEDNTKMTANVIDEGSKIATKWESGEQIFVADNLHTGPNCPVYNVADSQPEGDGVWLANEAGSALTIKYTPNTGAENVYAACMGRATNTYIANGKAEHVTPGFAYAGATFEEASYLAASASISATTLVFKPVFGLLEFTVNNPKVKSIAVQLGTEAIPTVFDYNFVSSALENVTKTDECEISVDTCGTFYIPIVPGSDINGFTIELFNSEEETLNTIVSTKSTGAIARGAVVSLGEVDNHGDHPTVTKSSFDAVNGTVDTTGVISFKSFQGDAATAPSIQNKDKIRLYQAPGDGSIGGYIEFQSTNGDLIQEVTIKTSSSYDTKVCYTIDDAEVDFDSATDLKKSKTLTVSCSNAHKVSVFNVGTGSSGRLEIASIKVTYVKDTRNVQTLSFPKASYNGNISDGFTAPTLSGASTSVTYSSTNPAVASVNASTGAITLNAVGTCTIKAVAAGDATYKDGYASYKLTVANVISNISAIKALATGSSGVSFVANLTDAIVTAIGTVSGKTGAGYIEDSTGGLYLYMNMPSTALAAGSKINGVVSGKVSLYNGVKEITELDLSNATVTTGATLPLHTVTIETLNANYTDYEYLRVKIEDATVTDAMVSGSDANGTIKQDSNTINTYASLKNINLTSNSTVDIVGFPSYYNAKKQVIIWNQSDVTLKGGANTVTIPSTKSLSVGDNWTIEASCASGDSLSYEIVSGSSYISLDAGVVTATAEGTAVIKATSPASGLLTADEATCSITVTAAGGNKVVSFDFNKTTIYPSGFPTTSGTSVSSITDFTFKDNNGDSYAIGLRAPDGYRRITNSSVNALFFGKSTASISTTACVVIPNISGYKLTKVEILNSSNAAAGFPINIFDSTGTTYSTAVNTEKSKQMVFDVAPGASSYMITTLTSAKNMQFQEMKLTYAKLPE